MNEMRNRKEKKKQSKDRTLATGSRIEGKEVKRKTIAAHVHQIRKTM